MLVLPSGREIAFGVDLLDALLHLRGDERDEKLLALTKWVQLLDFVTWREVLRDLASAPPELVPLSGTVPREEMLSGFVFLREYWTLADYRARRGFSEEDFIAIRAWFDTPECRELLTQRAWPQVTRAQQKICAAREAQPSTQPSGPASEMVTAPAIEPSPERLAKLAALSARRAKDEAEEEAIRSKLGFRVEDLERHDYGVARVKVEPNNRLEVGRRECWIEDYYQWGTHSGQLCGMPLAAERTLIQTVKRAKSLFDWFNADPFVVPPLLRVGNAGVYNWEMLPPVTTVAMVRSHMDQALLVWFQDGYGVETPARVKAGLAAMDWGKHSVEWNP